MPKYHAIVTKTVVSKKITDGTPIVNFHIKTIKKVGSDEEDIKTFIKPYFVTSRSVKWVAKIFTEIYGLNKVSLKDINENPTPYSNIEIELVTDFYNGAESPKYINKYDPEKMANAEIMVNKKLTDEDYAELQDFEDVINEQIKIDSSNNDYVEQQNTPKQETFVEDDLPF